MKRQNGLWVGYHGSHYRVAQWDLKKIRGMGDYGPGIYFATSEAEAKKHGPFVHRVRIRMVSPLVLTASSPTADEMKRFWRMTGVSEEYQESLGEGGRNLAVDTFELISHVFTAGQIIGALKKLGYDGIVATNEVINKKRARSAMFGEEFGQRIPLFGHTEGDFLIVFDGEQIENA